ncbi:family 20 glycosylhydrolase [Mycoplasma crocodyli]|uniref:Putative beta-N-acetylhexosaminidase n=1 Tax=Mycoplasma crocodyli (strain ATCC 51981 / MP145) TaxID=512564 RepID=A7UN08_MYCCM|nr:family 20 glycosylhydrolase [Mycoplasma crocodyli]ABU25236.1 putative beta-N-acetylhexosaminidase [Mycoplasma crocodyli MP145]ADE19697.1 putative beta-N-acetylhexosaminidase [Mycoplasma crocodyli MP145]
MNKKKLLTIVSVSSIIGVMGASVVALSATPEPKTVPAERVNLLTGKTKVTSDDQEGPFPATSAIDNDRYSRWSTNQKTSTKNNPHWIKVDMETPQTVKSFNILFERNNIRHFKLYLSATDADINKSESLVYDSNEMSGSQIKSEYRMDLSTEKTGVRFAKLVIQDWTSQGGGINYANTGVVSFELFNSYFKKNVAYSTTLNNLAKGKTATASNNETGNTPNKTVDGDEKTRWATERNESSAVPNGHFLMLDLGKQEKIRSFSLLLERNNISEFEIYASNTKADLETATTMKTKLIYSQIREANSEKLEEYKYNFTVPVTAQFIKVLFKKWDAGNNKWPNVSVREFSLYDQEIDTHNILEDLATLDNLQLNAEQTKLIIPTVPAGYVLKYLGTDYEQIIDKNLNVHKPLTEKTVKVDFELTQTATGKITKLYNKPVKVPGLHTQEAAKNKKPNLIPELAEWYSDSTEKLELGDNLKVYYKGDKDVNSTRMLNELIADYKEVTNKTITLEESPADESIIKGALIIDLTKKEIPGYDKETYGMEIKDNIKINATNSIGAYWATRTFLQILKLDETHSKIEKGLIKDYPKYRLRGVSIDVGRKPMSIEMLKNFVKELSWYKMNSLQVHLSDNLIWLEDHVPSKDKEGMEKAFDAYSAWRLESTVKNNEGKTVTADDFYYTKEQFVEFINYSRELGIEIVPELDVPAHALSVTKIFKEFALMEFGGHGGGRRPLIDHIDIRKPEAITLIKKLLDEYIDKDGIFSKDKGITVHIGADEFEGSPDSYYDFCNIMFQHFKDKGVQVRIWGGFSRIKSSTKSINKELAKDVEMNLWSNDWSKPMDMYDYGYKVINTLDQPGYMVPNGGGGRGVYQDYLSTQNIYNTWEANVAAGAHLPAASDQMLGGAFAIWGDALLDTHATGLNELDLHTSLMDALPVYGLKLWGNGNDGNDLDWTKFQTLNEKIGISPNDDSLKIRKVEADRRQLFNFDFKGKTDNEKLFDKAGTYKLITNLNNATLVKDSADSYLQLNGGNSSADLPIGILGFNNKIKFRVKRQAAPANQKEEILFSAKSEYGEFAIKAKQKYTGKFGFSRENMDYSFNYELPLDQWVEIELVCIPQGTKRGKTKLFVNGTETGGEAVGRNGYKWNNGTKTDEVTFKNSTFFMPLEKIGSSSNSFKGQISNISQTNEWSKADKTELQRLESINLTVKGPRLQPDKITNSQLVVSGNDSSKETVTSKIIEANNQESYIIVRETITSVSSPTDKIVRDILVDIEQDFPTMFETQIKIEEDHYTEASVKTFKTEIAKIDKSTLTTKSEYDKAITTVNSEKTKLVENKALIIKDIEDTKGTDLSIYSQESVDKYLSALEKQKGILENKQHITRTEYTSEKTNLVDHKKLLIENKVVAKQKVEAKEQEVKKEEYTPESLAKYEEEIKKLNEKINNKTSMTKEEEKAIEEELNLIQKALVKKSTSPETPTTPVEPTTAPKKKLSGGAITAIVLSTLLGFGVVAAIILFIIKRKKDK